MSFLLLIEDRMNAVADTVSEDSYHHIDEVSPVDAPQVSWYPINSDPSIELASK